jgi:hypothetical protein
MPEGRAWATRAPDRPTVGPSSRRDTSRTGTGCQYDQPRLGQRLTEAKIDGTMGTVGDALDNAVAEGFFATLEYEPLDRHIWANRTGLRSAVFDFIETSH